MKNKFFALFAIAAMCFTCACSEEETEETLEEKCQKGDAASCLVGTWQMLSIQDAATEYYVIVDFQTGPGKLVINEDGTFSYTYATALSSLMAKDCVGEDTGKWTYDDATKTISIKFTVGIQCNSNPTSAVVKVDANELTFNKQVFQTSEDIRIGAQPIEYYKRVSTLQ